VQRKSTTSCGKDWGRYCTQANEKQGVSYPVETSTEPKAPDHRGSKYGGYCVADSHGGCGRQRHAPEQVGHDHAEHDSRPPSNPK
jgi:hypothetical protein